MKTLVGALALATTLSAFGATVNDAMESHGTPANSGSRSSGNSAAGAAMIEQGLRMLNEPSSQPHEDPAADAEKARQAQETIKQAEERQKDFERQQVGNKAAFDSAMNQDVPADVSGDCDCSQVVGSCVADVKILEKYKTGVDFKVSSSSDRCSKVSYYIDSTPYVSVLVSKNYSLEHSASIKDVTQKSFRIERCELCKSN